MVEDFQLLCTTRLTVEFTLLLSKHAHLKGHICTPVALHLCACMHVALVLNSKMIKS